MVDAKELFIWHSLPELREMIDGKFFNVGRIGINKSWNSYRNENKMIIEKKRNSSRLIFYRLGIPAYYLNRWLNEVDCEKLRELMYIRDMESGAVVDWVRVVEYLTAVGYKITTTLQQTATSLRPHYFITDERE